MRNHENCHFSFGRYREKYVSKEGYKIQSTGKEDMAETQFSFFVI